MNNHLSHAAQLAVLASFCSLASADVTLIGAASIPGDALDKSGLTETIGKNIPHARLGSFGSSIDYTGKNDLYIAADDRGPGNGELPWRPRFQTFHIAIDPGATPPVKVDLVSTTLLSAEDGTPLTGLASAFNAKDQPRSARYDAEGVRLSATGTLFLSDEYGPWVDEFAMDGKRLRRLPVPARYFVEHPDGDPEIELMGNTRGRQPNRGFEGLAISPDKKTLWAMLQSPLIQDGGVSSEGKRIGLNLRILEINIASGATCDLVYVMDSRHHGINELLAINDHEMLVLERDGSKAEMRALYLIDTHGATDISGVEALPSASLPESITPVKKRLWLDFTDKRFGLAGPAMPEKIEGLTFGPNLPDGRRTLVVTTDNDLRADQPSWFWVFAFASSDVSLQEPIKVSDPTMR